MNVRITDEGIYVESTDPVQLELSVSWDRVLDGLHAAKEFVRFILPGGFRTKQRPRRRREKLWAARPPRNSDTVLN